MKRQYVAVLVVAVPCLFLFGAGLMAQDKYAAKAANGVAFAEFKGYESWQLISVSQPDAANGCGTSKTGCIKAILGNPAMIRAYAAGIPANGQAVPDGAVMAKIEWLKDRDTASPYGVTVPGAQTEVSFMVKDSTRFKETDGWGYATFQTDAASKVFKPSTDNPSFAKTCHACHTAGATKKNDFVYTGFAER